LIEWLQLNIAALVQVIIIDIVLAGDNAIIVGLAASRVAPEARRRVIFWGLAGAVVLRIALAAISTYLLAIVGLMLAGGLLLLWVCWKMYWELTHAGAKRVGARGVRTRTGEQAERRMSVRAAITQIVLADVSMSLDNVLAVAGVARNSTVVLIIGLGIAVLLMAVAANFIADNLARYPWVSWIGFLIILYVALDMTFEGSREVACAAWSGVWCAPDMLTLMRNLLGR
jgi:YjbE family integral membrane protein